MRKSMVILLSTACLSAYADSLSYASYDDLFSISKSGIHTYYNTPHNATDNSPLLSSAQFQKSKAKDSMPDLDSRIALRLSEDDVLWGGGDGAGELSLTGLIPPQFCNRGNLGQNFSPYSGGEARESEPEDDIDDLFDSYPLENSSRTKFGGQFTSGWEDNKLNGVKLASVCFITDAGNCSGDTFSKTETPENGSGNPGSEPKYEEPSEQCVKAGYTVTSCPAGSHGDNPCPADSSYYMKCVCDANMTQTCTKPYYGVGASCDGKYASCQRDDDKACREDGYTSTGSCGTLQVASGICPYNGSYHKNCVCRSDLVTCTYPQTGVGTACDGKYASCQCPSSYQTCDCGGATGATSCTVNGTTKYSSCKSCCTSSSSNYCSVHGTCHGDCCTDGTIQSCDTRCGGSGCSTDTTNNNSDNNGLSDNDRIACCDPDGSTGCVWGGTNWYNTCKRTHGWPDCGDAQNACTSSGGTVTNFTCSGTNYNNTSAHFWCL